MKNFKFPFNNDSISLSSIVYELLSYVKLLKVETVW
jgi:hypothetical protein